MYDIPWSRDTPWQSRDDSGNLKVWPTYILTYWPTYLLTGVGARDAIASKKLQIDPNWSKHSGLDPILLPEHGYEEPDVLCCPHTRWDQSYSEECSQCLLARPLCWRFPPWPVLWTTQSTNLHPGHPRGTPRHPRHPLRPHNPLCAQPQLVQCKKGDGCHRPRNPVHISNIHQSLLQLQIWSPGEHDTKDCSITVASPSKIPLHSQHFHYG